MIVHTVANAGELVRRCDPAGEGQRAIVLAHGDDVRRQGCRRPLGQREQPAPGGRDPLGEGPAVRREQRGNAQRLGRQPAEPPGLRGVGRDQVRLELAQLLLETRQGAQVAPQCGLADQRRHRPKASPTRGDLLRHRAVGTRQHHDLMARVVERNRQIAHMGLRAADLVGPGHDIGNSHRRGGRGSLASRAFTADDLPVGKLLDRTDAWPASARARSLPIGLLQRKRFGL